jgi:hypothetical protein
MMRRGMTYGNKITVVAMLASAVLLAGCDWFEDPVEANLPPDTELIECGGEETITEGDDVTFVWSGTDIDGHVSGFEVSYDEGPWEPTSIESLTVQGVEQGNHVFMVRAVDDDGDVDPDPARCVFVALDTGEMVGRVVLIELFTTNTCPSCPKAETALQALLEEMGAGSISVIAYHDKPTDAPDSDGLATNQTDQRIAWYTDNPGFPGAADTWPTAVFDGLRIVEGAYTAEAAETAYRLETDLRAEVLSPLSLRLEGDIGGTQGTVTLVVKAEGVPPQGPLALRVVVSERDVKYRGYFATHYDFVARLLLDDEPLGFAAVGDSMSVHRQFEVDPSWELENVDVIAFVQDTGTMEVIQSGRLKTE